MLTFAPHLRHCLFAAALALVPPPTHAALAPADLAGAWSAELRHAGSTSPFGLVIVTADSGRASARISLPAIHGIDFEVGGVEVRGDTVLAGPLRFVHDAGTGTLRGALPAFVLPVHDVPVELRRGAALVIAPRPVFSAPSVEPVWIFDAGAPLWADLEAAGGMVYAGGDDGVLHALDARTGAERWRFVAGGQLRARPTVHRGVLYVQADDGILVALDARTGAERWHSRLVADSILRVSIDRPGSKYDFYSSAVTVAGDRLLVGTHEGNVLALDLRDGTRRWDAKTGGPVLAAPTVEGDRVFAGSFDGKVYAFALDSGRALWSFDTHAPVTSSPVPDRGVVVAGSRSYDLFGLDAATGAVRWNRYVWFSWIESTPVVRDGIAYLGSSDAARIFAVETRTGHLRWESDVHGITWPRPAVTGDLVLAAVRNSPSIAPHQGRLVALDRATGAPRWQYANEQPEGATHRGFGAAPVVLGGRAFVGGLDGRVRAFEMPGPR